MIDTVSLGRRARIDAVVRLAAGSALWLSLLLVASALHHRGAHIVDARTGAVPTGAFAQGEEALAWLHTRPQRSGVVVRADGTAEVFAT